MCLFDINHPKNGPTLMRCCNNRRRKRLHKKRSLNEQNRSGNEEENAGASSTASWTLFMTPCIIILLFSHRSQTRTSKTPVSVPKSVLDAVQDAGASSWRFGAFSSSQRLRERRGRPPRRCGVFVL